MRKLATALRRKLFDMPPENALHARRQFLLKYIGVSSEVIRRIVDGMIHKVVCGIVVVQVGPGAKTSIRPGCLGSGLQYLIGSWMPGRIGPTPRPILPARTMWRHRRASARGD